ncbi:MAG: hypothetical protein HRU19_16230 [Pseudobacteriovorax sp.]|nr:hypothetical protein [Pseudobacteriovorax sp.]
MIKLKGKHILRKLTIVTGLLIWGSQAFGAYEKNKKIKTIYPTPGNDLVLFQTDSGCKSSGTNYFSIDVSTPGGKATLSVLLAAAHAGRSIDVRYGTCTSGTSAVDYIVERF